MMSIMRITEMYDKDVFTDTGEYFGKVSDVVLGKYMINGWVIKSAPNSILKESLGDVKAVIVPHRAVKAIGDVVIVSHNIELAKTPESAEDESETETPEVSSPEPAQPSFGGPSMPRPSSPSPVGPSSPPFRF